MSNRDFREEFYRRLLERRPQDRARYQQRLAESETPENEVFIPGAPQRPDRNEVLETIVSEERPVLFVDRDDFDAGDAEIIGDEAKDLVRQLEAKRAKVQPLLPLIGRIDVLNFPNTPFLGTGWFVDTDIVVTNRHVASLVARNDGRRFAFQRGVGGAPFEASLCTAHERDDLSPTPRVFAVREVLYIEPDSGPNDIAFLRVGRSPEGAMPPFVPIASGDSVDGDLVAVIGYPARATKKNIPDQGLMRRLYRDRFDVKRIAPGYAWGVASGAAMHDCTTLGGNSGSIVLDLKTGEAVGLHFSGLYKEANYAVPASTLKAYVTRKRWNQPPEIESRPSLRTATTTGNGPVRPKATPSAPTSAPVSAPAVTSATFTIPLSITVSVGAPTLSGAATSVSAGALAAPAPVVAPAEAVRGFWGARPEGVIGARVGYYDDADRIGDRPFVSASVAPSRLDEVRARGPREHAGYPIEYRAAEVDEQVAARPSLEAIDIIAYDDDARTSEDFSFDTVSEPMSVILHVGPEYSWDVLREFLSTGRELVSAMYEFHGPHIKDALEARLTAGGSLRLIVDNATFVKPKDVPDGEFDRVSVFDDWATRFGGRFDRVVAPEGKTGLIANSYHIKVTVREDDVFWLSSGNWKKGSSQPVITEEQRAESGSVDLPGNREWHVVIKSPTLAKRFRSHIRQDLARAAELGAGPVPKSLMTADDESVEVPIEEAVVLERAAPSRILAPKRIERRVRVTPLLTPDQDGAVYSEAVLSLIRTARRSLLFQIPYIGTPSNPDVDRGYIDALLEALADRLANLEDGRVILRGGRSGGKDFSSPRHVAWWLKSKGVDVANRLRVIDDTHTKGMVVDGRRALVGSHNWSQLGVTLNRDASLLFDDKDIASYYADAFEIDWDRALPVRATRFVRPVRESVGGAASPAVAYRSTSLADLGSDD